MTEYPVECFEHNGEPYGRYCNLHKGNTAVFRLFTEFVIFIDKHTFPMPGGTIGKTYEREEVEMVKQRFYPDKNDWFDCNDHVFSSINKFSTYPHARQIFRLGQPLEKKPETVDNDIYFEVAEIAQNNLIIQDPEKFKEVRLKHPWNEKAKKRYHAQVQFDALQFMRDLKRKGYKITKHND